MSRGLVLASQSPRRRELLSALGITFEVVASGATELKGEGMNPEDLAQKNARLKALWVAERQPDRWVLGSDTVVALETDIFGKPDSMEHAESMLTRLQGRIHRVITGVCLVRQQESREETWFEVTKVGFRHLTLEQIRDYLARINPLDKAGAYAIQDDGERIVSRVEGSLSNVVGLPLESLELRFQRLGVV